MLDSDNKVKWEWLDTEIAEGFSITTCRLEVPDGWVVSKVFYSGDSNESGDRYPAIALTYVPDKSHNWNVKK